MLTDKEIKKIKGLSQSQAEASLKNDGYNELPGEKSKNIWQIIFNVMKEPMLLLLLACSIIYFSLGDTHEAWLLFGAIILIISITIYQENKTEKALYALRNLASPRALVIRDGLHKIIPGREVVKGDYLILREGDRVAADGVILWAINLFIDESILTGESMAVQKITGQAELEVGRPALGDTPFAYSGSLVTGGQGIVLIKKTGQETEMGKIGKMLNIIKEESTPLQKGVSEIVKKVASVGIILCLTVASVYILKFNQITDGLLAGLTLAMSILPEELPIILTIFLSLGAWRISKKQVLTRKISAVETLGSASVLCVDKTGTLTQNKMQIEKIFIPTGSGKTQLKGTFFATATDQTDKISPSLNNIAEFGYLSCKKQSFDPMEIAIKQFSASGLKLEDIEKNELLHEYPLSHKLLAMANAWRRPDNSIIVAAKGAPEAIAELCRLNKKQTSDLMSAVKTMALDNLRILGVAMAKIKDDNLPKQITDFDFKFLGLVGLADPIRESAPLAIAECYEAGIKIIMITGDYPETAKNIAKRIGLKNADEAITGEEFDMMSDKELFKRLKDVTVFSRMIPTQKLRLVEALKKNGEIVAMTGDGVNDAPALKSAHIGVAMGQRGTDVSREASAIVLLNDDFSSLVKAIKLGRRIFDNIKKAVAYVLSIHVPIAGISLIPIIFNWPLILYPVHIVFFELVTDPVCSVLFEAEPAEKNIMKRPPRGRNKSLVDGHILKISLIQGFIILLAISLAYITSTLMGKNEGQARAITFASLIFSNIFLVLSNRSWTQSMFRSLFKKNPTVWWILGGAIVLLLIINFSPSLNNLFKFSLLGPLDLGLAFAFGLISIVWHEIYKFRQKAV